MKTSRAFLAPARKSCPVFLPFKTAPPIRRRRGFARQSEGRHNITHYTLLRKVCAKGVPPLESPCGSPRKTGALPRPFQLRLAACLTDVRVVRAEATAGAGRGMRPVQQSNIISAIKLTVTHGACML